MKMVKNSRQSPELSRWLIKCPVTSGISHMLLHLLLFPVSCWMKGLPQYPGSPEPPVWKLAEGKFWKTEGEFFLPQKSESIITGNVKEHDHMFLPFVVRGIFWTFSSWKLSVKADIEGDQISFRTTTAGWNIVNILSQGSIVQPEHSCLYSHGLYPEWIKRRNFGHEGNPCNLLIGESNVISTCRIIGLHCHTFTITKLESGVN